MAGTHYLGADFGRDAEFLFEFAPQGGARRFLEEADLSDADREKIASGNWDRLCSDIRR